MFRKAFSCSDPLLLAIVFAAPGFGQAQHQNAGHAGPAQVGTYHAGAAHVGTYHAGPAQVGTYHSPVYHNAPHYGAYHSSYPHTYYGHYGYRYGRYGDYRHRYYGMYPYYYGTYPYEWLSPTYDPGFYIPYWDIAPDGADAALSTTPVDPRAYITVKAPADAQVWFDDVLTTSTGPIRQFDTPPLSSGKRYSYEVRASWNENGRELTQTQRITIAAGDHVEVAFPGQPNTRERIPVPPME